MTTMTDWVEIFRVEDHKGLGPYVSGQAGNEERDRALRPLYDRCHLNFTPGMDELASDYPCGGPDGLGMYAALGGQFGFRKREQLDRYFAHYEQLLSEWGFKVAVYRVNPEFITDSISGKQCIFLPEESEWIRDEPWVTREEWHRTGGRFG